MHETDDGLGLKTIVTQDAYNEGVKEGVRQERFSNSIVLAIICLSLLVLHLFRSKSDIHQNVVFIGIALILLSVWTAWTYRPKRRK